MKDSSEADIPSQDPRSQPGYEALLASYVEQLNLKGFVDPDQILEDQPELGPALVEDLTAYVRLQESPDESGPLGTIGDFTLRREVGRGGMGIVYDAWQTSLERQVALKVLPAGVAVDDRSFQRFMREARAAAKLHHPNVVPVFAVGQDDNTPFYAMEFVTGKTLAQILDRLRVVEGQERERTRLLQSLSKLFGRRAQDSVSGSSQDSDDLALEHSLLTNQHIELRYLGHLAVAFAGVADGLQHAHSHGIVHRDIKPSNLILDRQGRLRVLDFGLARQEGQQSLTATDALVGTPLYMSPEQAQARKVPIDHRTDVYSLGATLYEMIAGRPPIEGKTPQDTLSQIISRDPDPLRRRRPKVPRDLETIVLKCLRKEPKDRFGTAEALAQDLRRFSRGDPIEARPQSPIERLVRRARRHAVRLSLVGLAVLLISVTGLLVHQYRVREAEAKAAEERAALQEYHQTIRDSVSRIQVAEMGLHVAQARESGLDPKGYFTAMRLDSVIDDTAREPLDQAIVALKETLLSLPRQDDGHEALYHLARALELRGDHDAALETLGELRRVRAGFVPATVLEADVQRLKGSEEAAVALEESASKAAALGHESWVGFWLDAREAERDSRWRDAVRAYGQLMDSTAAGAPPYEGFPMETRLRRGLAHLEAKELAAAVADFAVARYEWPEAMEPRLLLGRALYMEGSKEEAERVFVDLYDSQPSRRRDLAVAWVILTYSYEEEWEDALRWADRLSQDVVRDRTRSFYLVSLKRFQEAEEIARAIIAAHDDAAAHHALGLALRGQNKVELAISSCEKAVELDPRNFAPYVTLSQIVDEKGQLTRCVEYLRAALELEPDNSLLLSNLGSVLARLGEMKEARKILERSYKIQPTAVACTFLAMALEPTNATDLAARKGQLLEEAVELDPEYWAAWLQLGIERYQRQRNTLDGLEKLLEAARLKPDSYPIHLHAGFAFESLGLEDDALDHFIQAAELVHREGLEEKVYLSCLMQVGDALAKRSRIPRAREQGLALLREAADDPRFSSVSMVLSDLAGALVDNERYQEAFDVAERALQVDRGHPLPLVSRGIAHGKLGRPREALGDFLAALQAGRDPYFTYVSEPIIRLFYEHRDADFGEPLVQLKRGLEGEFARGRADAATLWNLWILITLWLDRAQVDDVLKRIDELVAKAPLLLGNALKAHGADVRWVLERLRDEGVVRIHCGGPEYRDSSGRVWSQDRFFLGGVGLDVCEEIRTANRRVPEITGCDDPTIYQTVRRYVPGTAAPFGYRLPVLPGDYRVTLHFVEMASVPSLASTFAIDLEERVIVERYKPQQKGVAKAIQEPFEVKGVDALLSILLKPVRGLPQIGAIEIERLKSQDEG